MVLKVYKAFDKSNIESYKNIKIKVNTILDMSYFERSFVMEKIIIITYIIFLAICLGILLCIGLKMFIEFIANVKDEYRFRKTRKNQQIKIDEMEKQESFKYQNLKKFKFVKTGVEFEIYKVGTIERGNSKCAMFYTVYYIKESCEYITKINFDKLFESGEIVEVEK